MRRSSPECIDPSLGVLRKRRTPLPQDDRGGMAYAVGLKRNMNPVKNGTPACRTPQRLKLLLKGRQVIAAVSRCATLINSGVRRFLPEHQARAFADTLP